jgi:ParB family chromosome partitioning protein
MPDETSAQLPAQDLVHQLPIDSLIPNPNQPRRSFDEEKLEELAQSISIHGVIQPLIVRPSAQEGLYDIIAGERRWKAAKMAGLQTIPALVRDAVDSRKNLELSLIENIQREDLNPIEKAKGYHALLEDFALTQEEVATRVGQKRATIANMVRLLDLPQDIQDRVASGTLSMGHARTLLALPDREQQRALADRIIKEQLSVRDVERAVQEMLTPPEEPKLTPQPQPKPPHIIELEERIMQKLGCKTCIQNISNNRGKLIVEFADNNDFERILECLGIQTEM